MPGRTEVQRFGGRYWRITEPGPTAGCRVYMGLISGIGAGTIRDVVLRAHTRDEGALKEQAEAKEHEAQDYAVAKAVEVVRAAHLGRMVSGEDLTSLLLALAPTLSGANTDRLAYYQQEALYACNLQWSEREQADWTKDPLSSVRESREQWDDMLDRLTPDVTTRLKLSLWAFLFIARPSSAA